MSREDILKEVVECFDRKEFRKGCAYWKQTDYSEIPYVSLKRNMQMLKIAVFLRDELMQQSLAQLQSPEESRLSTQMHLSELYEQAKI